MPPASVRVPERFVLLHPYARGEGKSLAVMQVIQFCNELWRDSRGEWLSNPMPVVVAGQSEIPICEDGPIINLLNRTTLAELIWLLRRAAFVVSVDSGPMHIAAALNAPLIAIHTWSDPAKVGPYNRDAWVWKDGALAQVLDLSHTHAVPDISALAAFVRERVPS